MKKYYIAVDCEGVACAVGQAGIGLSEGDNYRFARLEATREAAAAARGLFDAGADEVLIWDAHGTGVNLDYDLLDSRCKILLGAGHRGRFVGLDSSWTGVLFIGYHAMAGTQDAVLAHTFTSKLYQYYRINGANVGELAIDGAYAGAKGVPVVLCASDDCCVAEAKALFGEIATVETKRSLSWNSAISKLPAAVCQEIYQAAFQVASTPACVQPFTFSTPLDVEIRFQRADQAALNRLIDRDGKAFAFLDVYTRVGTVDSICDLF